MDYIFDINDPGARQKANKFFLLTKALRNYQRRWLKYKDYKDLDLARKAAAKVDKLIKSITNPELF